MSPAEDAEWQEQLAGAITRAIPGAVVTFTIADETCAECGHQHAGADLGGICIGCPCERANPEEDMAAEAHRKRP